MLHYKLVKSADTNQYSLKLIEQKDMPKGNKMKQGWGLAAGPCLYGDNGKLLEKKAPRSCRHLYATDSTTKIFVIDPIEWRQIHSFVVPMYQDNKPLHYMNELEIPQRAGLENYVFANAFYSNNIHMIDLRRGLVVKQWDMSQLIKMQDKYVKEQVKALTEEIGTERAKRLQKEH